MTSKCGYFAELEYIPPIAQQATGRKASEGVKSTSLRPFRPVSSDHTGKGRDATFSAFDYILTGSDSKRIAAAHGSKAAATERLRPFKPASPMKRATAAQAGELSGTISGRYAHILDGGQRRPRKGQVAAQPKKFLTRPSPQGGPGVPGATLSQLKHTSGVAGEYAYHANPYAGTRHAAGAKAGEGAASKPFKAACHSRYGGEFGRIQYEALGTAPKKQTTKLLQPFKPGFAGRTRAFSPQPAYMACPEIKPLHSLESKGQTAKHSWRPSHASVTSATRSIVVMNLR